MSTKAYVLIRADVGKTSKLLETLKTIPGITTADLVAGPYDVIAVVEAGDASELGKKVLTQIHGLDGLNSTLTCIVVG